MGSSRDYVLFARVQVLVFISHLILIRQQWLRDGIWCQKACVQSPAIPFTSCATFSNLLNLFEYYFHICEMGIITKDTQDSLNNLSKVIHKQETLSFQSHIFSL